MRRAAFPLFLFLAACQPEDGSRAAESPAPSGESEQAPAAAARMPVARDTVVELADGSRYVPGLHQIEYLGQLPARGKQPYLVLSAFGCTECDANRAVWVVSPGDGPVVNERPVPSFLFPGRQIDPEDPSIVWVTSRLFFGRCLQGRGEVVVQFARFRLQDDSGYLESVAVAEVQGDTVLESDLDPRPPLEPTLAAVRQGACAEVPPQDMTVEP